MRLVQKRELAAKLTSLRRKLVLLYVHNPIGLRVMASWFASAATTEFGPGDFLDHKYPTYLRKFMERCHTLATLCLKIERGEEKTRQTLMGKIFPKGKRAKYSLVPKDDMLVSLGAYLQTHSAEAQTFDKSRRNAVKGPLQRFCMATGISPNARILEDISARLNVTTIPKAPSRIPMETPFGHDLLLDNSPLWKKYPALRKIMIKKRIISRPALYKIAREIGYSHVGAVQQINFFIDAKIISQAPKSRGQLMLFSKRFSEYLKKDPADVYKEANLKPQTKIDGKSISPRGNGRKFSAPPIC